jgi:RNA polymerase sigma-70 factor (sigma-E family)
VAADRSRDLEFVEYVSARRAHLRRTAYLLCGEWHQAEDLVQTALAKLYVAWPRVRRDGSPEAYVRRILVRAHVDEIRRPWRRERSTDRLPDRSARVGLATEERDALMTALAGLPAGQRNAVVLRHWVGLSVEETAADLGCSTGTVKSQTARGIHRLREAMTDGATDAVPPQPQALPLTTHTTGGRA